MRRDMDLIRSLLFEIEGGKAVFSVLSKGTAEALGVDAINALSNEDAEVLRYHLDLLEQAGFAKFIVLSGGTWQVERMTWKGHEFLDTVRDPEIWRQTKVGAAKVGSWSIKTLADIAVAIGKSRLEQLFTTGQIGG